jgi:hypothetical protein
VPELRKANANRIAGLSLLRICTIQNLPGMQQADTRVWEVLQGVRTPDGVKITKENQIVWIGEAVLAILLKMARKILPRRREEREGRQKLKRFLTQPILHDFLRDLPRPAS